MLGTKLPGNNSNEERPSRRDFLLGIAVANAVPLPVLSAPARAAISMLRTGLPPFASPRVGVRSRHATA